MSEKSLPPYPDKNTWLPGRNRRRILRILKVVILIYCSVGIAFYYLQEKFLFHPVPLAADYKWPFKKPFEEYNLAYTKVENLNVVRFLSSGSIARGAIIYFHGNVENIARFEYAAEFFTSKDYEVWMADYPGFGKTTGELTEEKLYDQAAQVYKLVNAKFSKDSIIIYGKSLGTGIAAHLAAYSPAKMLILETPYSSIPDLFSSYAPVYPMSRMSKFKIPTGKFLDDCEMPVIIFHGNNDDVIPLSCAAKLKEHLKPADKFIEIEGGKHNNIISFPKYKTAIDSLLNQ